MSGALIYLVYCFVGYAAAMVLRKKGVKLPWTGTVQVICILMVVFFMGMRVGSNQEIVGSLGSYGLYALAITIATMVGSASAITLMRKVIGLDRQGNLRGADAAGSGKEKIGQKSNHLMILGILGFVSGGVAAGYLLVSSGLARGEVVDGRAAVLISVSLSLQLFLIGIDLGMDGHAFDGLRHVGLRVFLLPVAIVAGTLAGAAACAWILPLSTKECLAIGAGFGWYSIAPGIIMDAGYITAGTVSFMHNVMRETFAIVLIPIAARYIGCVETIGLPGSSAMDTCLPIVERVTNSQTALYSFVSGFVISVLVPVAVPFFL